METFQFNDNPIIKDFDPSLIKKGVHYGTSFSFTYGNINYKLLVYGEITVDAGGYIQVNDKLFSVNSTNGFDFIIK
jgi:hypothetical protein